MEILFQTAPGPFPLIGQPILRCISIDESDDDIVVPPMFAGSTNIMSLGTNWRHLTC